MATGKKTGGRKKGSGNLKKIKLDAAIVESGLTPLEYMMSIMRSPLPPEVITAADDGHLDDEAMRVLKGWHLLRMDAAKAAAPYIHPKLNAIHTTTGEGLSFEDWLTIIDDEPDDT